MSDENTSLVSNSSCDVLLNSFNSSLNSNDSTSNENAAKIAAIANHQSTYRTNLTSMTNIIKIVNDNSEAKLPVSKRSFKKLINYRFERVYYVFCDKYDEF